MTLDWFLWIAMAVGQSTLSVLALRARLKYTWFARYIYFATAKTFTLMAIAVFTRDLNLYIAANSTGSVIGALIVLAVIGSIWRQVFRSEAELEPGTLTRFRTLVLAIVCPLCAVLIGFFRAHSSHNYFNPILNLETIVLSATSVTLALMIFYAKHLGISWRAKPAVIVGGFLWCFGMNWLAIFMAGQEAVSISTAQRIGQAAYLVTLALWGGALLRRERVPRKTTNEKYDQILREFELREICSTSLRTGQPLA
ncbi:MAG TPA: hypothetical protein VGN44_05705 [Candidatus Angelobacter sp.]|jgi:uncharacterized membrane protein